VKTQYYTAATLDGFLATEEDSLDWLFALGDPSESSYAAFIAEVGAIAMGSATYEWVRRELANNGSSWPYEQPVWIFSHRPLPAIEGADLHFVSGDVGPVHVEMRAAAPDRNIWLAGGGDLVGQFHDAGLLDELIVQIGSTTLGSGKPLLPRRILSPTLRLSSVRPMGPGFVELRYDVVRGDPD